MWALAIPAAAAAVSAVAQWMNSREAMNATAAERARIQELIDRIQEPDFDVSEIRPEDLQLVGNFVPQAVPLIQEATPQLLQAQQFGAREGRQAQMSALQNLLQVARSGRDPIAAAQQAQAARQAAAEASSARQSGAMEAQRRGFGYSPLAANQGAQQDAMQRLALSGQAAAADAYGRRLQAMGQAGDLGGQIFQQGLGVEQQNAAMINDFNRRLAERTQANVGLNIGNINEANMRNLGERQRIADANVLQRNQGRTNAQALRNTMAQQQYQNKLGKIGVQTGQSQQNQQGIIDLAKQQNLGMQSLADLVLKGSDYYRTREKDKLTKG